MIDVMEEMIEVVAYTCDCGFEHEVTVEEHEQMVAGELEYVCADCRTKLVLA
jgi:predicted SprT family Zn-dependent metalloprotease